MIWACPPFLKKKWGQAVHYIFFKTKKGCHFHPSRENKITRLGDSRLKDKRLGDARLEDARLEDARLEDKKIRH